MYIQYKDDIEDSSVSDENKEVFRDFLKLLEEYDEEKLLSFSTAELRQIFRIAAISPRVQIEIWRNLPDNVVNSAENLDIFEDVLENKFGEYIHGIDKKALIELLNESRYPDRCNRS